MNLPASPNDGEGNPEQSVGWIDIRAFARALENSDLMAEGNEGEYEPKVLYECQ
ncbi:MAG: hypothetical protein HW380_3704 [Magnetococcales bacterium]|nr:hypothetical protein [Magnetococcales bacterium]